MPVTALRRSIRRVLDLRDAWRWSADWRTFQHVRRPTTGVQELSVRFAGQQIRLNIRGGTHDLALARNLLCDDSPYRPPVALSPRVIFDIGANIGVATLYFAALYPDARIYCFEPLPANIEMLGRNTAPLGERVTIIPKGLGEAAGRQPFGMGENPTHFGGGGFRHVTSDTPNCVDLPVITPAQMCREHEITHVDLVKIDTEGAEWPILRSLPRHLLEGASVVMGELHGWDDHRVIELLSQTHDLGIEKPWNRGCYPFVAVRKPVAAAVGATLRLAA